MEEEQEEEGDTMDLVEVVKEEAADGINDLFPI